MSYSALHLAPTTRGSLFFFIDADDACLSIPIDGLTWHSCCARLYVLLLYFAFSGRDAESEERRGVFHYSLQHQRAGRK